MKRALDEPSTSSGKRNRRRLFTTQQVMENLSDDEELDFNLDLDLDEDYDNRFSNESSSEESVNDGSSDEESIRSRTNESGRVPGAGIPVHEGGDAQWTNVFSEQTTLNFNPASEELGPVNLPDNLTSDSTPLEFLSLFADNEFWTNLTEKTNLRAQQVRRRKPNAYFAKSFSDASVDKMKAFIGVRLYLETVLHKLSYRNCWEGDGKDFLGFTPGFRKVMTRDDFLALWSFLHVVDEEDEALNKTDKIYKTRPMLDGFLVKFQKFYKPHEHLSLDEGMIPAKNRLSIKQYIKDKPTKWGIKSFLLCDANTGYVYNAEIYTGSAEMIHRPLGATGNTVVRLVTSCDLHQKSHVLVMDRYYNSVALAEYALEELKTGVIGTIMTNRKQFPKSLKKVQKMERGESRYLCKDSITVMAWQDRKPIHFISNYENPAIVENATRRRKDGTLQDIQMPLLVKNYNSFMGGCDKNDQMARLHRSRKHYKWPRRLFMKCFMWACYNSYVIYHDMCQAASKKPLYFTRYMKELSLLLAAHFRTDAIARPRKDPCPLRLSEGRHFPEVPADASFNHVCVVCSEKHLKFKKQNPGVSYKENLYKLVKTSVKCSLCDKFLCVKRGSSCWADWHTKVEYWR